MQYSNSLKFNSAYGDALRVFVSWVLALFLLFLVQSVNASEKPNKVNSISADAENQALVTLKQAYKQATQDWEYVLANYVDEEGRTNFKALSEDIAPLENVVSFIGFASPTATPELFTSPEEVMSYHINSYNALAMYGVVEKGIPDGFTSFFSRAAFFKFRDVVIGGKVTNLYDYENDVIRPLNEPRAHFALNCMVKDCPRLPKTPFYPEQLNETLEQLTYEFFSKKKHFYLDDKRKRAYVSEILDFYTEDFVASGKARDLPQYINKYIEQPIPSNYKLRFIDYDWRINAQPEKSMVSTSINRDVDNASSQAAKNPIVEAALTLHSNESKTAGLAHAPASELAPLLTPNLSSNESADAPFILTSTPNQTTVLELYSSQGCSSCPPAEKWISGFVDSEKLWTELVPINFHVDYWDYLGWKDPFADSAFSKRQRDYKRVGKANTVATPGFVLNGRAWNGWFRGQPLPNRVAPLSGELHASVQNNIIEVSFNNINRSTSNTLVVHAALLGFGIETSVKRGENAGRKLTHDFIVVDYESALLSSNGNNAHAQQYVASLPLPSNTHIKAKKHALVVWVSEANDPSPLQVAASWWLQGTKSM
ncbi:DUF1223 domain-containing protein [Alteromonas sp. HB246098]